jgi:hypothetical protein
MKSLMLFMVVAACCLAQELQTGELHACASSKKVGDAVQSCSGNGKFYHLMTTDHEYVFDRQPSDRIMGRVSYRIEGGNVTVYEYIAEASEKGKKLFTRELLSH